MNTQIVNKLTLQKEYTYESVIGKGGEGVVYLVKDPDGVKCAMKVIDLERISSENEEIERHKKELFEKKDFLLDIRNDGIVNTYDIVEQGNRVCIITEYVKGMTLYEYSRLIGKMLIDEVVYVYLAVLDSMTYLHTKGIVVNDLKPSNIMISDTGNVVLIDPDSLSLENKKCRTVTKHFSAPEKYMRDAVAKKASDYYSFGACLFFSITGERPLEGHCNNNIYIDDIENRENVPIRLRKLINELMNPDVVQRMTSVDYIKKELLECLKENQLMGQNIITIRNNLLYVFLIIIIFVMIVLLLYIR